MPILAAWLGSLFTSLVSFFAVVITKRVAIIAAVLTAVISVTAAFVAAMQGLFTAISYAAPAEINLAWGWLVPDNLDNCIAAVIAGHLLRWAYDWNVKVLQMKLF